MKINNREIKTIYLFVIALFIGFLLIPIGSLLYTSFQSNGGISLQNYANILGGKNFIQALVNSFTISSISACITIIIAFSMAYSINYTNIPIWIKKTIKSVAMLPMLLPTITYGFAIIYSFGKQGLLTKIFGMQLFNIYGFNGILLGYVIYTLPIAFMLINNAMSYIDKKYIVVSKLMKDNGLQTFMMTLIKPLLGTLVAAFIQTFFLSFTDFGIPASVGGEYTVVSSLLYSLMLGSIPDFAGGAVVAMVMLIPSIISITLLHYLEKYNIRYTKISTIEFKKNKIRDSVFGGFSLLINVIIIAIFAVIFIVPFVKEWPYTISFSTDNFVKVISDGALLGVFKNSLIVAFATAIGGTLIAYGAAIVTARSTISKKLKKGIESAALITNTIPGMVLGIAYLFIFSGTPIQNTFVIIVICNIVHFFSTPYLMMKNSLMKMNASFETTAKLMGDSWIKTIYRIITPNAMSSLLEVFSYYFVNAMVTVSAVIFIAGARTMVMTTKIKELQHFAKFNEIFVLSILILVTNCVAKLVFETLAKRKSKQKKGESKMKAKVIKFAVAILAVFSLVSLTGCSSGSSDQVIIYSNGDEEATNVMKKALDENGFKDQYLFQTFGTSELGGKLLAEGTNIEADLITMSSFYIQSAKDQKDMFVDFTFDVPTLSEYPKYMAPLTAQEGAIIINTKELEANNLPMPTSIKDLADPIYKDMISVTDIASSSTAWLLIQAIVSEYGEVEAKEILTKIYQNAGPHIEESGSGPIKKVRAGEVAIGFGLRHQAVADKESGLPITYVDPTEGNFSLTESVAVINKNDEKNKKAMEMAKCIMEKGRVDIQKTYPLALYNGEAMDTKNKSTNPKVFKETLTVELLKKHQEISKEAKQ